PRRESEGRVRARLQLRQHGRHTGPASEQLAPDRLSARNAAGSTRGVSLCRAARPLVARYSEDGRAVAMRMSKLRYPPSSAARLRSSVAGLGRELPPAPPARRIVSLVPSFTETLFALGLRNEVIGRTEYCVQPPELVERVPAFGGTKTPHLDKIEALAPDLVIASAEENVKEHVEQLIDAGLRVYVSLPL